MHAVDGQNTKNYVMMIYVRYLRASYANLSSSDDSSKPLETLLISYFELYQKIKSNAQLGHNAATQAL